MKKLFLSLLISGTLLVASCAYSQTHQLVKIWETDSILKVPESVLYHAGTNALYVSNIDGKPSEKDSRGSIAKVSIDGKNVDNDWVTNLSAPKGMAIYKNALYVSDVDEVVSIDLTSGKILHRIPVAGAKFLNDVTVDKGGAVYVSDSGTGLIHRVENGKVSTYLDKQMGVNGLLSVDDHLYILAKGDLWKADKAKKLTKIAGGMEESTDGIEQTSTKDFIVSSWNGVIYYVKADGSKQELSNTKAEKISSADIGFDAKNNIVYVPTFFGNRVVAYQLKTL